MSIALSRVQAEVQPKNGSDLMLRLRVSLLLLVALFCAPASLRADEEKSGTYGDLKVSHAIDAEILAVLQEKKVRPAAPVGDAEFVRRIYLDVLGRIPTPGEVRAYLADQNKDRKHRLIDRLLAHPEMPIHWADVLDVWLNGRRANPGFGAAEFRAYLQKGLAENKSWDRFARELLLPGVDDATQPAAYFLGHRLKGAKDEQLDAVTVAVASAFFGVRMECAKCHDHPYVDAWKQDHYYGLASFLSRTEMVNYKNKPALGERAEGEVNFNTKAREQRKARLMFLDSKVVPEPSGKGEYLVPRGKKGRPAVPKFSRRKALAEYALTPQNPYFKRALVNRVWKQLMGRGLVEPVDQIHDANPASHPKLFALLADDFAGHGFDLRRLLAVILHSEAYRRSSVWTEPGERPLDSLYAVAILRPLSPEQLARSVATATGYLDTLRTRLRGKEPTPAALRTELDKDIRLFAAMFHNESDHFAATTAQALFLTYNKTAQKYLQPGPQGLVARLSKVKDEGAATRQAYLAILARQPTPEEEQAFASFLRSSGGPREQLCRDLVWALLTSAEFRFNH